MVQPNTPPRPSGAGRRSILGRLSLSPSQRGPDAMPPHEIEGVPRVPPKHVSRSARTPERYPAVAGPSYESMSAQTLPNGTASSNGPSAYAADYRGPDSTDLGERSLGSVSQARNSSHVSSRSQDYFVPERFNKPQPPLQYPSISTSPPRSRNPIYPALASPPRNHPAAAFPSTPAQDGSASTERSAPLKVDTGLSGSHARATSSSRTFTRSSPVSPTQSPRQFHIIASSRSPQESQSTEPLAVSPQRTDKQGRPMISTRRSAASSSRTITQLNNGTISSGPSSFPASPPSNRRTPHQPIASQTLISSSNSGQGLTEAGAYARAMTSTLTRSESAQHTTDVSTTTERCETTRNTADRPLPRPPGQASNPTPPVPRAAKPSFQSETRAHFTSTETAIRQTPSAPRRSANSSPVKAARSSYSHAAQDSSREQLNTPAPPRQVKRSDTAGTAAFTEAPPLWTQATDYPESQDDRTVTRPAAQRKRPSVLQRPSGRLQLDFLLAHPAIQSSILGAIGINTFLSLSGSSENVRRQFTGESVGRWVLGEWTVHATDQEGNRWPNLTVWEGFLESLLHDPATYSTYPARWHNLLRHLSLSHTLVVLYLRSLPQSCYPNHALLPFEDDGSNPTTLPFSPSSASLSSMGQSRSRIGSAAGSDAGSVAPSRAPRRERVVEIVMPEPLAARPTQETTSLDMSAKPMRRRGSISSLASVASFSFGRRRSNSLAADVRSHVGPLAEPAASLAPGKAGLPPVSYPSAKRYGFRNASDAPGRRRIPSDSRPGSLYSFQTSPSVASYMPRTSQIGDSRLSGLAGAWPLQAPPPIGVRPRSSFGSVDSNRRSDLGSPVPGRKLMGPQRSEPAFDKPMPYIPGRAPILRVFIPLSEKVRRWPSAEGAAAAIEELEKCGALKRMRLGDLIVNTAIRAPKTTEHVLLFVPFVKHLLVPMQYTHIPTGHLPAYVDAFALPPSYYYPFLPASQIIFLNLGPYRDQGLQSMRLASDRRDMTVASGARISAKRYLYVTGVEIGPDNKAAPEWHGMVSLEAEGTSEGKAELERRFGTGHPSSAPLAPWEIVKEKSMGGTVWLRLVKERVQQV